jgi:cytidylate kinase
MRATDDPDPATVRREVSNVDATTNYERCLDYINSQAQTPRGRAPEDAVPRWRAVTISRQAGAGAHVVAEELIALLQVRVPSEAPPWTIFDRNLVERVLEDHDLPGKLAKFMPEDRMSNMSDTLDELFGLHPSSWTLVRKTADTILRLAELGNVVIIGRGANIITKNLDSAFHVRLVGSETKRIEHLRDYKHLSLGAASLYLRDEDLGRKRYVKKYYATDIDDPLLYHLVINTDLLSYEEAARTIGEAIRGRSEPGSMTTNGNRPLRAS